MYIYLNRYFCCLVACIFYLIASSQTTHPAITHSELIFAIQEKHTHGSNIVALPNGDLLTAWFEGSGERTADDVRIMGSRRVNGRGWSSPFEMADTPGIPDCNPVIFLNQRGKLFLIWIAVMANKWENSILRVRSSTDYSGAGAPRWDWQDNILFKPGDEFAEEVERKFEQVADPGHGWSEYAPPYDRMIVEASKDPLKRSIGWMTRTMPMLLGSDSILLPLYSDGYNFSIMGISTDAGKTWSPSLPVVGRGPIQPGIIQTKNGEIKAYMRDSGDPPSRVQISTSRDMGRTWSPAVKTDLPNTASIIMHDLKDGRWLALGNFQVGGRHRISIKISHDEGGTWNDLLDLENKERGKGSFSYPGLTQSDDGLLHITYSYHLSSDQKSIKYVQINPELLK